MVFVKLLQIPKTMQSFALKSLGSFFPPWSTDRLDLLDDSMSLWQFAYVLVVKDPNADLSENAFVFVVPLVVSDGLFQRAVVHCFSSGEHRSKLIDTRYRWSDYSSVTASNNSSIAARNASSDGQPP